MVLPVLAFFNGFLYKVMNRGKAGVFSCFVHNYCLCWCCTCVLCCFCKIGLGVDVENRDVPNKQLTMHSRNISGHFGLLFLWAPSKFKFYLLLLTYIWPLSSLWKADQLLCSRYLVFSLSLSILGRSAASDRCAKVRSFCKIVSVDPLRRLMSCRCTCVVDNCRTKLEPNCHSNRFVG